MEKISMKKKVIRYTESDIERLVGEILSEQDGSTTAKDDIEENLNEGRFRKTREDRIVLDILKRVKEEFPADAELDYHRRIESIEFTLNNVNIDIRESYHYGDLRDSYTMYVNNRELQASRWAIRKLFKYMEKIINKRDREEDTTNIEVDLLDPDYAQDVFDRLDDQDINEQQLNEGWKDILAGGMMALATMLPKVADAQDGRVDWETVKDTVEYVSKDLDRDTIRRISTVMSKTFKDTGGNVDKMVQKIKWEYTKPNSWEVDPSKTEKEKIKKFEKVDPVTQKRVRLTNRDGKKTIYFDGKYRPSPEDVKEMYYDTGEITKKEYDNYVEKYNRWLSLFKKR
jgi:hypothetical protein